jgi:phosphoribosylformylglycinamidine cyclo-ligase
MYRVLNCGVGMVIVVPESQSQLTIDHLNTCGEKAWLIGEVVKSNGQQVLI